MPRNKSLDNYTAGGFFGETLSQILYNGSINDLEAVAWSSLQGFVINVISMLSTSICGGAGGASWSANVGLNIVMGFPVSLVSFAIDMLRHFVWNSADGKENEEETAGFILPVFA